MYSKPLDEILAGWWNRLDPSLKSAFAITLCVNALAFGFEMTNLSMLHDDFDYIFLESAILGHYNGRFGFGWLHYYTQSAFLMPFFQMAQGIVLMSIYGLFVARFWGARKTLDLTLIAAAVCIFPYMAQLYQFNVSMAPFPAAHLLAALAVILSTRATFLHTVAAALLYAAAFSIYQSVIANACTILGIWLLCQLLFSGDGASSGLRALVRPAIAALISLVLGGVIYVGAVHLIGLPVDDPRQATDQAFRLSGALGTEGIAKVLNGTRAFFFWPESYFPNYLKRLQLAFVLVVAVLCIKLPKTRAEKVVALGLFGLALLAPRALQFLHPAGYYPNRSLTAYALIVASCIAVIHRAGPALPRNVSAVSACVLLWGFALQCNWISTVNYMNTLAHRSVFIQVLDSVRSVGRDTWDGERVIVVGRFDMSAEYPYKQSDGVASEFLDGGHMQDISRLMRTGVTFLADDGTNPKIREFATGHRPWPHPQSVAVIDGKGVVVLSNDHYGKVADGTSIPSR